jgi:hypothetical protein
MCEAGLPLFSPFRVRITPNQCQVTKIVDDAGKITNPDAAIIRVEEAVMKSDLPKRGCYIMEKFEMAF